MIELVFLKLFMLGVYYLSQFLSFLNKGFKLQPSAVNCYHDAILIILVLSMVLSKVLSMFLLKNVELSKKMEYYNFLSNTKGIERIPIFGDKKTFHFYAAPFT